MPAHKPSSSSLSQETQSWIGRLSLQQKAWGITTLVIAALAIILTVSVRHTLKSSFDRLERNEIADSAERLQRALALVIDSIERSNRDNATWGDTYKFILNPSHQYYDTALNDTVFANLDVNAILIFNQKASLVAGRTCKEGEQSVAANPKKWEDIFGTFAEASAQGSGSAKKGLLRLPEGLAVFSCLPILKDDGSGPPRGSLIHMRYVDDRLIQKLQSLTNLHISIHGMDSSSQDPLETALAASTDSIVPMAPISEQTMSFHLPLRDALNHPVAYMHVTTGREIHGQGSKAMILLIGGIVCIGAIAGLVIIWLLRSLVIRPLETLNTEVNRIGLKADPSVRVHAHGTDEIASLAGGINVMLDALARAETEHALIKRESDHLHAQLLQAQKMEAIGTMAGGLAHDFNNMLNSIMGSTDLLRYELPLSHPAQEHIKRIEKAGISATGLVRQLLAVSRRQPLKPEPVHMIETAQDVLRLLKAGLPKSIDFQFEANTTEDMAMADSAQIHQVIMNLATNSAHALAGRERGFFKVTLDQVSLPIATRPETLKLRSGRYLRITLSDNGCGIARENIEHIFEPFFTTKPSGSGSGLGLAVVHGIISKHNGSIGVESEKGHGTSFFIHLPLAPFPTPTRSSPPKSPAPSGSGSHILLIDDDKLVRDTIANGMKRLGHTMICTGNTEEALRMAADQTLRIDAVITDQVMPGMSGLSLGAKIQAHRPGLPMILISGYASEMDISAATSKGFQQILNKPVSAVQLHDAILTACRPRGAATKAATSATSTGQTAKSG
ncbi:MAG: CHASE4 domain-containing protein [Opitutaceae bacterium]|jgi:signal transduction histidine kinase/CheY-like chemotaxis protein